MQALVSSTASGGAARHSTGQESRRSFACLADGGGGVGALPLCAAAGVPALHALPRHVGGRARHRAVGRAPPRGRLLRAGRAALPAAAAAAHAGPDRGRVPRRAHRRAPAGRGVCAHPAARGRQRGAARGPEAAHPAAAVVPGSGREELFVGPGGMEVHPAQSSDDAAAGLCRHHARGGGRGADAAGSADGARARADGPGHRVVVLCRQADGAGQAAAAAGRLVQAVWAVAGLQALALRLPPEKLAHGRDRALCPLQHDAQRRGRGQGQPPQPGGDLRQRHALRDRALDAGPPLPQVAGGRQHDAAPRRRAQADLGDVAAHLHRHQDVEVRLRRRAGAFGQGDARRRVRGRDRDPRAVRQRDRVRAGRAAGQGEGDHHVGRPLHGRRGHGGRSADRPQEGRHVRPDVGVGDHQQRGPGRDLVGAPVLKPTNLWSIERRTALYRASCPRTPGFLFKRVTPHPRRHRLRNPPPPAPRPRAAGPGSSPHPSPACSASDPTGRRR